MEKLDPPLKRYLMGARPSHGATKHLAQHFEGISQALLEAALEAGEYLDQGKPTRKAALEGLVDSCEGKILWNLERIQEALAEGTGMKLKRQAVNQEVEEELPLEPVWVNLGTLGTYFSVSANQVGKWLTALELRDEDSGEPTEEAMERGYCTFREMHVEGKKTRRITHWNLHVVRKLLVDAGHELNFDYEAIHKGKGRNSSVAVSNLDARAAELAAEFTELFKNPLTRHKCRSFVKRTPRAILVKVEEQLKKPGFLTRDIYLKYL